MSTSLIDQTTQLIKSKCDDIVFKTLQLELACEASKPILVHERDAHDAVVEILDKFKEKLPTVVIHCFTGTAAEIRAYIARGFYIGVTGFVCKGMLL